MNGIGFNFGFNSRGRNGGIPFTITLIPTGIRIDWTNYGYVSYETEIWGKSNSDDYALLYTIAAGTVTKNDIVSPVNSRYYKIRFKNGSVYSNYSAEKSIAMLGTELVINGTFDSDVNGWISGTNMSSQRDISIFTNGGIKVIKGSTNEVGISQLITGLIVGETYYVSCRAFAPSTNVKLKEATISNTLTPTSTTTTSAQVTAEDVIQTLNYTFTASATTQNIYLINLDRSVAWGSAGDYVIFDDISVKVKLWASINSQSQTVILTNTFKLTSTGAYDGIDVLKAGANYGELTFLRDFVMSTEYYGSGFSNTYLKNYYLWYKSLGLVWTELDRPSYLVSLAYNYYKKSNDLAFANDNINALKTYMDSLTYSVNGLVTTPDGAERKVGWGFQDQVYITGELLFASVLAWRAYTQLSEMALAAGDSTLSTDCDLLADNLKSKINSTFYVASAGKYYMKASTSQCKDQFDLIGTVFAIYLGIIPPVEANLISNYIISIIDECIYNGGVKHVPYSHEFNPGIKMWEVEEPTAVYGKYQHGGAWATPIAWFLYVINMNNPALATTIFDTAFRYNYGHNVPECYSPTQIKGSIYSTSQTAFSLAKNLITTTIQ